jgi:heme-degrading monooxygenase HmoA
MKEMPPHHTSQVLRIFRARVKAGSEVEWESLLEEQITSQLEHADGLVQWYRGRPFDEESHEFVFVTLWRDRDALRAFAGASAGPVLFGNERDLADWMSVEQYELA